MGRLSGTATAQVYIGRAIPHADVEVSGGGTFSGGYDLGSVSAEETRNTGGGPGPFVLFTATSRVKPSFGLQGRLGVFIAQSASLEAGIQLARPTLSSRLSADAESAPDVTATETLTRLVVEVIGPALERLHLPEGRRPFVRGGADTS